MNKSLSRDAARVQAALKQLGMTNRVLELPGSTRTAAEAATTIGCTVAQIAKSLIFKTRHSEKAILIIASGVNRVNENVISNIVGEPLDQARAEFVREQTGFVIGGVPPIGHHQLLQTFIDADLLQHEVIWAAAGTPFAVFELSPTQLLTMTHGQVISVTGP